jgi:hypothetical protein
MEAEAEAAKSRAKAAESFLIAHDAPPLEEAALEETEAAEPEEPKPTRAVPPVRIPIVKAPPPGAPPAPDRGQTQPSGQALVAAASRPAVQGTPTLEEAEAEEQSLQQHSPRWVTVYGKRMLLDNLALQTRRWVAADRLGCLITSRLKDCFGHLAALKEAALEEAEEPTFDLTRFHDDGGPSDVDSEDPVQMAVQCARSALLIMSQPEAEAKAEECIPEQLQLQDCSAAREERDQELQEEQLALDEEGPDQRPLRRSKSANKIQGLSV